jgi:hypothetical protein
MSVTDAFPRRPTLLTMPALEAEPSSSVAPRAFAPQADNKTGALFYALLGFIILALVLGVFPPV